MLVTSGLSAEGQTILAAGVHALQDRVEVLGFRFCQFAQGPETRV